MNQPIIDKKGNGTALLLVGVVMILVFLAIPILLATQGIELMKGDDIAKDLISYSPFLLGMALGAWILTLGLNYSKTKILIFEDHIEGTGVVNGTARDFYLKYEKINSVMVNKGVISILSDSVKHELNLPEKDVKAITEFINSKI